MPNVSSFRAIAGPQPIVLILGSMPSVRSLERNQYYGHVRNHFWPMLAALLGEALPEEYEARLQMLKRHRIALWDVAMSCTREGSRDNSIKNVRPNDVPAFLRMHPSINTVVFNGRTAQNLYNRFFDRMEQINYISFPSTSPIPTAHCRNLNEKLNAWEGLIPYLPD